MRHVDNKHSHINGGVIKNGQIGYGIADFIKFDQICPLQRAVFDQLDVS